MLDTFLEKYNIKYEDLSDEELQSLNVLVNAVQQSQLTTNKIKDFITSSKQVVENELVKQPGGFFQFFFGWKKDIYLKARLKNYILLEQLFTSSQNAQKAIEHTLSEVKK